jgi:hypothetical protein
MLLMTALFSLELHAAGPLMHVAICNVDGVRDSIVARAKVETTLVYSAAGVTIVWHDCYLFPSPTQQQREPWFVVRLRTGKPPLTVGPASLDVMGKAYLAEEGGGSLSDAYLEAIQAMSEQYQSDQSALLGLVMAHELGHLLLGPGHTSEGVMQRTWGLKQMFALSKRWLKFSKEDAARIRRALETLQSDGR